MRILLLTHYYAPEFGAPQRRWSALVGRFLAAGHQVTVAAPVPHYPMGRPSAEQRREHPVGAVERGMHGETVLRTAYLPHRGDIATRTADHLVAAGDALLRLSRRFARPADRPNVIVATAPAIPTLLLGKILAALWEVPLVVEMRDAWPDLVTQVGGAGPDAAGATPSTTAAAPSASPHASSTTVQAPSAGNSGRNEGSIPATSPRVPEVDAQRLPDAGPATPSAPPAGNSGRNERTIPATSPRAPEVEGNPATPSAAPATPDPITPLDPDTLAVEALVAASATSLPVELPVALPLHRRLLGRCVAVAKGAVHHQVTDWQAGARAVVTTTGRFAEVLRTRGIDPVRVVRNGTDLSRIPPQRDHLPGDHEELRCLYLGNMGRSQGLDTTVRAAARLAREGVKIQLRLVGHGVEAQALADLARELDAPVTVLPRIPHREVGEQYAWADTVIVSLRSWQPFAWTVPSKLYEILATGRHITALLEGEAADVVRDAEAGDVLPPEDEDALVELWRELAADRSRTAVRASGRAWVAEHADDDQLARAYLEILGRVVANPTR